jgi:hypothetical protein
MRQNSKSFEAVGTCHKGGGLRRIASLEGDNDPSGVTPVRLQALGHGRRNPCDRRNLREIRHYNKGNAVILDRVLPHADGGASFGLSRSPQSNDRATGHIAIEAC